MKQAARAIIIHGGKILVMHRHKYGSEYFTLVGGQVKENETLEQALTREVKEETGLDVTKARLVFVEKHPEPYNQQFIYICDVAPFESAAIQEASEEGFMNKLEANVHKLVWADVASFGRLQFRTPQLHEAIIEALKKGFPNEPKVLTEHTAPPKRAIFGRIRRRSRS